MTGPAHLYHLALRDIHAAAGATFGPATGWSLPLHYGNPVAEYEDIRARAAVFDRSHRSRFIVSGADAHDVLGAVFAGYIDELEEGRSLRTVSLSADGDITDVVLISRTGGIAYLISGEPGQRFETLGRLQQAIRTDFDARVDDRTETTCLIGLAGPDAATVAANHLSDALPSRLQTLHCVTFEFHGFRALAVRAGDAGEDGFEFMLAPAVAQHIIETLTAADVPLAGHEALEIARVEACIPAFEPDLAPGLSPSEADLDALMGIPGGREGRSLVALLLEGDSVPVATPLLLDGAELGHVRSCLRSPGLNASIGLGIIDSRRAFPGVTLQAAATAATVVAKPFYRRRS